MKYWSLNTGELRLSHSKKVRAARRLLSERHCEESADEWTILGGGEWDHTESGYRLHQLSYASTAEWVVAIWWEGAIRRWWDYLNAPDKMPAQAEHDADAPKIGAPRLADWKRAPAPRGHGKRTKESIFAIAWQYRPKGADVAALFVGESRTYA